MQICDSKEDSYQRLNPKEKLAHANNWACISFRICTAVPEKDWSFARCVHVHVDHFYCSLEGWRDRRQGAEIEIPHDELRVTSKARIGRGLKQANPWRARAL